MFQRIVVPLDGSSRAEQALPVAARIARATGGSLVLLRVTPPLVDVAWQFPGALAMEEAFITNPGRAKKYLAHLAASMKLAGIKTTTTVTEGPPARQILSVAREQQADLIIICAHGYTGLTHWTLGSVALKITHHSPIPVLVLRPGKDAPIGFPPEPTSPVRILVALDGSLLAEAVLAPAASLSAALSAPQPGELRLTHVLPDTLPQTTQTDTLAAIERGKAFTEIQSYLHTIRHRIHRDGYQVHVTSSVIIDPDIARALIASAESDEGKEVSDAFVHCDLIALATHGHSTPGRWMMGSITDRVLGAAKLPLLIVRPQKRSREEGEGGEIDNIGESAMQSWPGLL